MRLGLFVAGIAGLAGATWGATAAERAAPESSPAPLAYEMSAWELAPELRQQMQPWTAGELAEEIHKRVALEKQRREALE